MSWFTDPWEVGHSETNRGLVSSSLETNRRVSGV